MATVRQRFPAGFASLLVVTLFLYAVTAGTVADFIQGTNLVVLVGHGLTALGRNVSEAYHRLNTFTAEVRRCLLAEQVAALKGTTPAYRAQHEIEEMYRFAGRIIYPTRPDHVMHEEAAE